MVNYVDMVSNSVTFEARWGIMDEWLRSTGRWDDVASAAVAASEWLQKMTEDRGQLAEIRIILVEELVLVEDWPKS